MAEEVTENGAGVEANRKPEESTKSDIQCDSTHVNGEKCEKSDIRSDLEDMVTSSCDTTNVVPETDNESACDSEARRVNRVLEDKNGREESSSIDTPKEDKGTDTKEEGSTEKSIGDSKGAETSRELLLFNEDIVCQHNLLSPTASLCNIPQDLAVEIMNLCGESIHPAIYQEDFSSCSDCGVSIVIFYWLH